MNKDDHDTEIKKYLCKTKLSKLKINKAANSIKSINNEKDENLVYYNIKQIKMLLFNYKLFKQNLTNSSNLNTYLIEQDILLNFVKHTFVLKTFEVEIDCLNKKYKNLIAIEKNIKIKNETENVLADFFTRKLKFVSKKENINEIGTTSKMKNFLVPKAEIKHECLQNNIFESRNEKFVAELKHVLNTRNIKSKI